MKKNSLRKNGLSMSEATSVSNLCHQRAIEITNKLTNVNNVEKTLEIKGKTHYETKGKPLPLDIVGLLNQKSELHAVQGFLMENLKIKDKMIKDIKLERFNYEVQAPERPKTEHTKLLDEVGEDWGKDQLSIDEINEWIAVEAKASHIGQFIHEGSTLDRLRKELPHIKTLEWITVKDGVKTPLEVKIHHTPEQLLDLHEELSVLHREANKRVNYFKAKVKNLVTIENGNIAQKNADEVARVNQINQKSSEEYRTLYNKWSDDSRKASQDFEVERNKKLQEIVGLRIEIPTIFKPIVDTFLDKLK